MRYVLILLLFVVIQSAVPAQQSNHVARLVTREQSLGKLLPDADIYSLTVDASFKHVAYVVKRGSAELAVVDGVEGREYDQVAEKNEMYFSPDGSRLAYVAKRGENSLVVVDGVEGKEYSFIYDLFNPIWSPDSRHIAYIASTGTNDRSFAVLDGHEQAKYELVEGLIFSPDGKKFAYSADRSWNRGTCLVVNGVEGRRYSGIDGAIFSPDSSRVAFAAFRWHPDRSLAVIDGKDGQEYEGSVSSVGQIVFSPDSKHTAYSAEGVVMRDDVPEKSYGFVQPASPMVFSPDSQRLAYVARGGGWLIVLDGKIFDDQQVREYTHDLVFSPDSRHLAYITRFDSPTNTGYDFAVLDGVVQKDSKNVFCDLHFSPDGKRLAYLVRIDEKEIPVYGEFRGGQYDRFVTCDPELNTKGVGGEMSVPFVLDKDGTLHAVVLRDGELFRLELQIAGD